MAPLGVTKAALDKMLQLVTPTETLDGNGKKQRLPVLIPLSEIERKDVTWLWEPYIPMAVITLLDGDPMVGKTFLACVIASIVSNGDPFLGQDGKPGPRREPGKVVYMSCEDDWETTLSRRFDALGANQDNIIALQGQADPESEAIVPISLQEYNLLHMALEQYKPALVVIDPIQGYLGPGVDMNKANEVRPLLARLAALAQEFNTAVLLIRHLGKSMKDKAIYAGLGTIDFMAAARSALLAGSNPKEPNKRAIVHQKHNLSAQGVSLGYTITSDGKFEWTGISDLQKSDILAPEPMPKREREESELDKAIAFLSGFLAAGPQKAKAVIAEATRRGISLRTLHRAKAKDYLGVESAKQGKTGPWYWKLPEGGQGQKPEYGPGTKSFGNLGNLQKSLTAARAPEHYQEDCHGNLQKEGLSLTAPRSPEDCQQKQYHGGNVLATFHPSNGESQNRKQVEEGNSQGETAKEWTFNPVTNLWEGPPDDDIPF